MRTREILLLSLWVWPLGSVAQGQVDSTGAGLFGEVDATISASALFASPVQPALALGSAAMGAGDEKEGGPDYLAFRVGPLWFSDDLDSLDTGVSMELAFGYRFIRIISIELQSGYFGAEDPDGSTETDVWGIPIVVNGRVALPIPLIHPYAGVGIGGYYVNGERETAGVSTEDDDFVFGGSIFIGSEIKLGPVAAGLQFKYVVTEEADFSWGNKNLDHVSALATIALRF